MKKIHKLLFHFFPFFQKKNSVAVETRSFFDYSAGEKIRLMRAAGREAQKEQRSLIKTYETRFGGV
ncbi:hypothetical protein KKE34_02430 [Patescibacteria group bacterium]|nr:hypothetical protein [Patescibacteria group bacterium]